MKPFAFYMMVVSAMALVGTIQARQDKEEPQVRLELDLVDGSHIIGAPSIQSVPVETSYAKMDVQLRQILTIRFGEDRETASIELRNGDKLKGVIDLGSLKLETVFGNVSVGIEHIRTLRVVLSGGALPGGLMKGLILYYSFDRDEGAKVADRSGNGIDGVVRGPKWTEKGAVDGAYSFAGSEGSLLIDNNPELDFGAGARTIGAWVKNVGPSTDQQSIFTKGANPGYAFRLSPSPDRAIEYFKSEGANYSFFTSSYTITDKAWHHLVVVDRGNGTAEFYKDGAFIEAVTKPNHNSDSSGKAAVGTLPEPSSWQRFNGDIDEVMVFSRALSSDEITQIYHLQK
jgi:hypothetical protein